MNVKDYELEGEWSVSNIGHTALAKRGSKKYFLKQYGEYKMPRRGASMSDKLYAKMEKEFQAFCENRIAINKALSDLARSGGNIILPTDWFVDDIFYTEATEFVAHLIPDEEILKLSKDEKLFIMLTAVGALLNIHRKNIVHSDLKRTNILAAVNSEGRKVAKIIDFDRSYFVDNIRPDELGGDQNFMSPELAQCFIYEMADEALANLSTKSDIFSLGLVFHDYLADGAHPKLEGLTGALKRRADEGKTVYCSEALLGGGRLVVSKKIGDKYLTHLIAAMLQPEPADRPTAQEVLSALKLKTVLPLKGDSVRIEGEKREKPLAAEIPAPPSEPTPPPAKPKPEGYCAPWEEHGIAFDEEKLKTSGYIAAEQTEKNGVKCYALYKADGNSRVFTVENLLLLNMAKRAGAVSSKKEEPKPSAKTEEGKRSAAPETEVFDDGTLWEKDAEYRFDLDKIKRAGYTKAARAVRNGAQGYVLVKPSGEQRFLMFEMLKMLSFAVK